MNLRNFFCSYPSFRSVLSLSSPLPDRPGGIHPSFFRIMRRRAVSLQDKGHNSKKTHQGPRPKSSVKGIRKSLLNNVDSNTLTAEHVKMTTDKKQNDKAPETAHGATNLFPWCLAYPGSMVSLNSPQIKEWTLKLASWNVNGLRAWIKANGKMYADEECPDVLAVQEIKCSSSKIPPESKIPGYYSHWYSAVREGYSGTGLYTRKKPINITYGIKNPKHDSEGRVITAEYENFYLIAAYVPNSGDGLVRLPYRQNEWDPAFASYLKDLDKKKPIIVCGDLNVAHNEIDLASPDTHHMSAGFTDQEREDFTKLLKEVDLVDTYRALYPSREKAYTFWSYRSQARPKNAGWRLDYFLVSRRIFPNVCDHEIRCGIRGSDHCPIVLYMKF